MRFQNRKSATQSEELRKNTFPRQSRTAQEEKRIHAEEPGNN
jgi:hypothetical protein